MTVAAFLGQRQKSLFPEEMKDFSDEDFKTIEDILPGSSEILQQICKNIHWYQRSVEQRDVEGIVREYKGVNDWLDKLGEKEGELWIYLIIYCDVEASFLDAFHALRRKFHPANFPAWKPRLPIETPSGRRPPFSIPPFPPPPSPAPPVPTPGFMPAPVARFTPPMPRYTDVAPPSVPTYGQDLQRQMESYEASLRDWYGRPAMTTLGPVASLVPGMGPFRPSSMAPEVTAPQMPFQAPRPFQIAPRPVPGAPVPTRPSCPPGQFWDGRQCRGSIAPGAAGMVSATGGGATMGPSMLPAAGPTSLMTGRYRPSRYQPAILARPALPLGQTFDEMLGFPPEVGDVLRLVYHGGGTWLGYHVASSNGKTPWFSAVGWMIMGGMGIAAILDVVSLLKRACGTHPPAANVTTVPAVT